MGEGPARLLLRQLLPQWPGDRVRPHQFRVLPRRQLVKSLLTRSWLSSSVRESRRRMPWERSRCQRMALRCPTTPAALFFHSRLRQLRATSFEDKLRQARGEGVSGECLESARPGYCLPLGLESGACLERDEEAAISSHDSTSGIRRRASCPDTPCLIGDASTATAVLASASSAAAEAEKAELRSQLSKAESQISRLSQSSERMRLEHNAQLAALRAESSAQARKHTIERESMRREAAAAMSDASRLQRALADEKRRSAEVLRHSLTDARRSAGPACLPSTPQAVAPIIAGMEVESLRQADPEVRARLKKKLQLKWHPDKCINAALAKCVMQELQQRPEW